MVLVLQIISGILLTFYFIPSSEGAFLSSDFLTREVWGGYILRTVHLNGASIFFFLLYSHMARGIFYGGFFQKKTWFSGSLIYLLSIGIAFLGYVLPWGQISFWGASVITNLVATIPFVGIRIVLWIWGGFNVNRSTLSLFFSFHYLLPIILIVFIFFHIFFLHESGRTSPQKMHSIRGKISFREYFLVKDSLRLPFLLFIYSICFFSPWSLGDVENWIPANPIKSPVHIQPEWYFLFAYAILRRVPNKLGGVICLLVRVCILFLLPLGGSWEQKNSFLNKRTLSFFLIIFFSLTWLGGCGVEDPFIIVGQFYSLNYFLWFSLFYIL